MWKPRYFAHHTAPSRIETSMAALAAQVMQGRLANQLSAAASLKSFCKRRRRKH